MWWRTLFLLAVSTLSVPAAMLTGVVWTGPYFVSDSTTVAFRLFSTDGHFNIFGNQVLGGAQGSGCDLFGATPPGCRFGIDLGFSAGFPDSSSRGVTSTAEIDGSTLTVVLGCPGGMPCPQTRVQMVSAPLLITGPGTYSAWFTASGRIEARTSLPGNTLGPLVLNEDVTGQGTLRFEVLAADLPGHFVIPFSDRALEWRFESIPEPSFQPVLLVLVVAGAARAIRRNS